MIALTVAEAVRALRTASAATRERAAELLDTWGGTWGEQLSLDRARVLAVFPPAGGPAWSADSPATELGERVHQSLCRTVSGVDHTTGDPAECAGVYLYLEGTAREAYAVVGVHDVYGEADNRLDAAALRQLAAHAAALADQIDGGLR